MKEIPLTQGKVALVDDEDYDELMKYKWYAAKKSRNWYAQRNAPKIGGGQITTMMHRQILNFPKTDIDHKDNNGLNNQHHNLRMANPSQNALNRRKRIDCSSSYKGVSWHPKTDCDNVGQWQTNIYIDGKHKYLGLFHSEILAALAYDEAARQSFGEFARPNFPDLDPVEFASAIETLATKGTIT
jgi:hypothetical protein